MGTVGIFSHDGIADGAVGHLFGEAVPGAKVFPFSTERDNHDRRGLLCHLVVETDFGQFEVTCPQLVESRGIDIAGNIIVEETKLEGKDTTVPQGSVMYQSLGILYLGLLHKTGHGEVSSPLPGRVGHDIAKLRRGPRGTYAHEHEVGHTLLGGLRHLCDDIEIATLGIGVDGHHHNHFVATALLLLQEMGYGQGNGRKSAAAFGLGNDIDMSTELRGDGIFLRHAGCDGNGGIETRGLDLPHHTLQHRLAGAVGGFQQFKELLGAGVV